jgi:transposase
MHIMLEFSMHITIESLWKLGHNKTEISRITKHDWKTVAKVIKTLEAGSYPVKKPHPLCLDQYKPQIVELIEQNLTGIRIHEELRVLGSTVSYSSVKKYIANIKKHEDVCIRFHTGPGEEAQVDFGYVGLTPDISGKRRKTWVFNMRLSYSRLDYYELVFDQKVETFIQCHINAFTFFKGLPKRIKIDNLKAAILEANFYEPVYQTLYKQFADYYGFQPLPCRVRKPQEKGKVESGIKYVKTNFFLGRTFTTNAELQQKFNNWLINKCNARVHGTTRRIPQEMFDLEEIHHLIKLPEQEFHIGHVGQRCVYHDCHVYINYNYYSVPFEYVGKIVDIELNHKLVKICYQGRQIAVHEANTGKGQFITVESHYPKFKNYLSTAYRDEYQVKMDKIGSSAGQLFLLLVNQHPHDWNRTAQGIISLARDYSPEVVDLACKRALAFNTIGYKTIKSICHNRTYRLPVEINYGELQ